MDKQIRVQVTWDDIDHGCVGVTDRCPIARALIKATDAQWVRVDTTHVEWTLPSGNHYYSELPSAAIAFIDTFDSELQVYPMNFTLDPELAIKVTWEP